MGAEQGRSESEDDVSIEDVVIVSRNTYTNGTQMLSLQHTYVCSTYTHTHNTTHKIPQTQNRWTNEQADDYEELLGILGIVRD